MGETFKTIAITGVLLTTGAVALSLDGEVAETKVTETTFAEIDETGKVLRVIVADQAFIDSGRVGDPKNWIETSNKVNYPAKEYTYDKETTSFITPKTDETTIFNPVKAEWQLPPTIQKVRKATST